MNTIPRDPYRNYKFTVEINGFQNAGFQKVSGLSHKVEVIEYREGAENETARKLPGQSKFDNVTLERGASNDSDFVNWITQIYNVDAKDGKHPPEEGWRKTVTIKLRNKAGEFVKQWTLFNAWPSEKKHGDLDASGNEVLIETLVLENEGIKEVNLLAGP